MKCYHTGLPKSMCGHCNGTEPIEKEPFHGRPQDQDTPRYVKGRDSAKWIGRGRSTGEVGSDMVRCAAQSGSHRGTWEPHSLWGDEQVWRSFVDASKKVSFE